MEINQVIKIMLEDLDFIVAFWDLLEDELNREEMTNQYKQTMRAYNHILGKVFGVYDIRFPSTVERFLATREEFNSIK